MISDLINMKDNTMSNSNIIFKQNIPSEIYTGIWHGGHIQGIAVDWKNRYIYCSFTTELVKLDFGW